MSIRDQSLYTLFFVQDPKDPNLMRLNEHVTTLMPGTEHYARVLERVEGEEYSSSLYDAVTGARLASTGYVTDKLKSRRLQLFGPDETLPFEHTGTFTFEWTFTFEGNKYKWKRSSPAGKDLTCLIKRGGDPDVEICLFRPGNSKEKSQLQILHYNVERFSGEEIKDVRGLEAVLCMTALNLEDTFQNRQAMRNGAPRPTGLFSGSRSTSHPPIPPQKPDQGVPRHLLEQIAEEDPGEVLVGVNTDLESHISRANRLLDDQSVLFIIIRSRQPEAALRATEVSLGVQRFRHRNMLPELHRYVIEEKEPEPQGPRIIKLDERPRTAKEWAPPSRLAIYLSRIELPDLAPKPNAVKKPPSPPMNGTYAPPPSRTSGGLNAPYPMDGRVSPGHGMYASGSRPPSVPPPPGSRPPQHHQQQQDSRFSKLLKPTWK